MVSIISVDFVQLDNFRWCAFTESSDLQSLFNAMNATENPMVDVNVLLKGTAANSDRRKVLKEMHDVIGKLLRATGEA